MQTIHSSMAAGRWKVHIWLCGCCNPGPEPTTAPIYPHSPWREVPLKSKSDQVLFLLTAYWWLSIVFRIMSGFLCVAHKASWPNFSLLSASFLWPHGTVVNSPGMSFPAKLCQRGFSWVSTGWTYTQSSSSSGFIPRSNTPEICSHLTPLILASVTFYHLLNSLILLSDNTLFENRNEV